MTATSQPRPNPYIGPRAFQNGETLYGRDREAMELLDLLIAERIVLLYSPSGAGKTSLIQAALIPRLEKEAFQVLPVMRVGLLPPPDVKLPQWSNRYVLSLLLCLEEALPAEQHTPLAELAAMELADYLDRRKTGPDEPAASVLIFDQFEEILTVDPTDRETKEAFFAQVSAVLRKRHWWALFAMREEYPAGLDPYLRPIPTRLSTTFRLDLLGEEAAHLAMQRPAHQVGVDFTNAAARKLVNDLCRVRVQRPEGTMEEQPGLYVEPVQLQVVCHRLWEKLPTDATQIGETDVAAVGDVDSALAGYYAERVGAIARETGVSERTIREWFDRQLITEQGIRGQVLQGPERSQGLDNPAIWLLVDAYLVRAEKRRGATWFELAHDRLIEPVRRNNGEWYQTHLSTLQRQAELWESQDRPGGLLLREEALEEGERWAAAHPSELTSIESDFLAACLEARTNAERERRQARRIRKWAIGLAILSGVALTAFSVAIYFFVQAHNAEEKAEVSRVVSLAQALAAHKQDDRSALVARRAYLFSRQSQDHQLAQVQAYLFGQQNQGHMLDQIDEVLRSVLSAPYFSHILHSHTSLVRSVAFSPDGKILASASDDKTVRLWDLEAPSAAPRVLTGHEDAVRSVAFSDDGKTIASGSSDDTVRLWDLGNSSTSSTILPGHVGDALSVAFSPNSKILAAGSRDSTVRLWNLGEPSADPRLLPGHKGPVLSVAFSPDGKTLASASDDTTVRLWDLENPSADPKVLRGHEGRVWSVAFSPDGKSLASGSGDRTIRLWDLANLSADPVILGDHKGLVSSVTFSPDGKTLASGGWDRTVRLWDLGNSGAGPIILRGHPGLVLSVAYSPDGRTLASGGGDKTVRLWDLGIPSAAPRDLSDHKDAVRSVAFSPDGKTLASGSFDDSVRLWDLGNSGAGSTSLPGHAGNALSVAFSPDGRTLASGSSDNSVRLWNLGEPSAYPIIPPGHEGGVSSVAFSPNRKILASASWDTTVRLWDLDNLSSVPIVLRDGQNGKVLSVAFSPDGKTLASGSDNATVRLWDLENPSAVPRVLPSHEGPVRSVAFSPDGKTLASGSDDTTVRLWESGKPNASPTILRGHEGPIRSVAFSPDGKTLASGSDDTTVHLWELGKPDASPTILHGHEDSVWSVAFSPDGKSLASGSGDKHIFIWIAQTETLADKVCEKVWRNLTLEEWRQFVGEGIPYERTCPQLPIHPSFIEAGRKLARAGDIGGAVTLFQRARELDHSLDLDPKAEAEKQTLVAKARQLVKRGKVKEALAAQAEAQKLDATLKIPAESWGTLCWFGSLWGYAKDVMNACEQAVTLAPESSSIHDSRGLARALTGNIDGAIADFQAFVKWTPNPEKKSQRQGWIDTLRTGKNPFTAAEIERLRKS